MRLIYSDYEFENRINNLSWTISERYNDEVNVSKEYNSKELSIYFAIMDGAMHKYIDWDVVKEYLVNRVNSVYNQYTILNLTQIILNRIVESKLIVDRPGVEDIRRDAYKYIVSKFSNIHNGNLLEKIKYALILESMGKHPIINGYTNRIINEIKDIDINNDLVNILEDIDKIYIKYFKDILQEMEYTQNIEDNLNIRESIDFDTFSNFMYEELYNDEDKHVENDIEVIASSMLVENIGNNSIEGNRSSNNRIIYVDEETANKIYNKIEHYYGKSYIDKSDVKKIENKNCKNAHEGCRIHFTDGVLRSKCSNIAQIKYVTRQKENNMSKFRDKIKIHKRNITKLKDSLSRILKEEDEVSRTYSDYGTVCANRVWRSYRSNNNKIFYKDVYNETGGYVIDILLDSSGSQRRNQANVATQGYIISKALTMAGIPNRVVGFSSFMDYTILKRFKDYEDKVDSSENIFEYFCAGNNRDGLAIKSICDSLLDRNEENKILIILSDGKPNDIKIGKDRERSIIGEKNYKGIVAVKDTAREVRIARQKGILVLGVFTGDESELQSERLIYGKDLIYTKDIDRFSDIVSIYLKKVIRNR